MIPIAKPDITQKEIDAVNDVLKSGNLAQGKKVEELENQFKILTTREAVATNNGTTALHLALLTLGIKEGDEVITTPYTFAATANSIRMCKAIPIFVDVNEYFLIDTEKIEEKITSKTKAIMPVNLYGQCADYDKIKKIALKHDLKIIEDAAQSIGATYNNQPSGSLGDAAAFSLYATKNIMAGEGGVVTFKENHELAKKIRHHGQGERYEYEVLGYNYRMTDLHAAIAVEQMKRLDEINLKRQENAKLYDELLKNIKGIKTPKVHEKNTHVYHQYAILVTEEFSKSRDELKKYLEENGVGTGIHYPKPLHLHKAFEELNQSNFPNSEKFAKQILSLPVHPLVSEEDIKKVTELIRKL